MAVDDLSGRRLGGFELVEPLGDGSFGAVWRARQLRLDRDVAVKILDPLVARDPNAARRFEREGRAAASLDHPAIVPVYEAGDEDGLYYLAMRLIDGETLADVITREAPLGRHRVADLLTPIADALDAAHAAGLIHRDVKPSNILLEDGRPYLSDFGIAASARELGRYTTGSIGTAEYMAPEQGRGEDVDHRADLYSLGVVAFHALTGVSPFARDDVVSTLLAHSTDPVPMTGNSEIDAFFARAMAKDPADRFESGSEFALALSGGEPPPGDFAAPPATGASRGRSRVALGAALVGALALVAGGLAISGGGDDSTPATTAPVTVAPEPDTTAPPPAATSEPTTEVTEQPAGTTVPDATEPGPVVLDGGEIAMGTTLRFDVLNPHANLDTAAVLSEWVLPVMYRIDENLQALPSLATGPPQPVDGDPTQLTWTIRDDIVWNDGMPVTTADIVATYDYLTADDTNATNTLLYQPIVSIEATDATTVSIELAEPNGAAYLLFSTIHPIISAAAWSDHLTAGGTAADFLDGGVTFAAGPYQPASLATPGQLTLVPNAEWSGDPADRPTLDRIRFLTFDDAEQLVAAQTSGEVDLTWVDDFRAADLAAARQLPDTELITGTSSTSFQLSMSVREGPLADPAVRQALVLALDRDELADAAVVARTGEPAEPWNSLVFAPGQADSSPFEQRVDLAAAQELLDAAGWTQPADDVVRRNADGEELVFTFSFVNEPDAIAVFNSISPTFSELAINLEALPSTLDQHLGRLAAGEFDLALQNRLYNNDPIGTRQIFGIDGCPSSVPGCTGAPGGVNFGAFQDDGVEALLDEADLTVEPAARTAVYARIDDRLAVTVPAIPLFVRPAFVAHDGDITGIVMTPNRGPLASLGDWALLAR